MTEETGGNAAAGGPPTAAAMFEVTMRKCEDRGKLFQAIQTTAASGGTTIEVDVLSELLRSELESLGYLVLPGQLRGSGIAAQRFVYVVSWREQLEPEPPRATQTPKRKK